MYNKMRERIITIALVVLIVAVVGRDLSEHFAATRSQSWLVTTRTGEFVDRGCRLTGTIARCEDAEYTSVLRMRKVIVRPH